MKSSIKEIIKKIGILTVANTISTTISLFIMIWYLSKKFSNINKKDLINSISQKEVLNNFESEAISLIEKLGKKNRKI